MPLTPRPLLSITDHSRDSAGLTYVYPVVSRRAGGVSIGINLNPNNACNWACIYCQVPDLKRGGPPPIDLDRLTHELRHFLLEAIEGDFLQQHAPPEARRLMDIAFSGNGEPTSATEFSEAVEAVARVMQEFSLKETLLLRLISNGSMLHRPLVRQGIARIGELGGEVWFKLDRGTAAGIATVNGVSMNPERVEIALRQCTALAPTWIQTCYFGIDGKEASDDEQDAYLDLLRRMKGEIKGVHLYGLARPSLQPHSGHLMQLSPQVLQRFADKISALGIKVSCNP